MDRKKDIPGDFLLCNRCGACRAVCPVYDVYREEWTAARGKVELAEAWFRGEVTDERRFQEIFDLCLHCMTCEENCPPGTRASEIVMAVRAEMGRKGLIPRIKRLALGMVRSMDPLVFRVMRALRLTRKEPVHGYGAKSPLSALYPLLGWPRERFLPMPSSRRFLGNHPEFFPASDAELPGHYKLPVSSASKGTGRGAGYEAKAEELLRVVALARKRNLAEGRSAYFYIGHVVDHFFPEEAAAAIRVLNILGIDVHVPKDQACCGAPLFYAGDIDGAREAAVKVVESLADTGADWIVTTCSSGGLMLKKEYPRILGTDPDGFYGIEWDKSSEVFTRKEDDPGLRREHREAGRVFAESVSGKVRDINELLADTLGLTDDEEGYGSLFERELDGPGDGGAERTEEGRTREIPENRAEISEKSAASESAEIAGMRVVTYHHPCHLNRGQGVRWQPEKILDLLPAYRYVRMEGADVCCGGGGAFTFTHSKASEKIAAKKADSIAAVEPDVVATACPVCRIQLMDMIARRLGSAAGEKAPEREGARVASPVELLSEELDAIAGNR